MYSRLVTTTLILALSLPEAHGQGFNESSGEQHQAAVSESKLEVIPLPPAEPACDVLDLAYFENTALANNPTLDQANARVQAARGRRLQAGLYQSGEYNFLTLLTAQRTFTQANLAYLAALDEMWSSAIEIDGLLLVGSLQAATPE